MVAAIVASPSNVIRARTGPPSDEIGPGPSSVPPTTPRPTDWDEEVVPALRKRLEEESRHLGKRISLLEVRNSIDSHTNELDEFTGTTAPTSWRGSVRLLPRTNRATEIIQDGLGSDELIPTEWATGSSARFRSPSNTIGYTTRSPSDRRGINATAQSYFNYDDQASPYKDASPPSPSRFSAQAHSHSSHQGSVSSARDRARRVARERSEASLRQTYSGDEPKNATVPKRRRGGFAEDEQLQITDPPWEETQEMGEESFKTSLEQQRQRTSSTPSRLDGSGRHSPRKEKSKAKERKRPRGSPIRPSPSGMVRSPSSNSSLLSPSTPSRIPLPVSGSMDKHRREHYGLSSGSLGKSKSGALLSSDIDRHFFTPTYQDVQGSNGMRMPSKANGNSNGGGRSVSERLPLPNTPPSQDTLDEFGPLGGVPKSKSTGGKGRGMEDDNDDSFASSTNPWDEQMLPAVARRLAQQNMLNGDPRLSRVEDLIDTWDKDGLPLSKHMIQLKQRAQQQREARERGLSIDRPNELADESDTGREGQAAENSERQHDAVRRQGEDIEMDEMDAGEGEGLAVQDAYHSEEGRPSSNHPNGRAQASKRNMRANATAAQPQKNESLPSTHPHNNNEAGCCKCVVM